MSAIRALNVPVHDTTVGLAACLPSNMERRFNGGTPAMFDVGWGVEPGDVLGVVTKCEWCDNGRIVHDADFGVYPCGRCDGTGYAPPKFVKVLAVWPIVGYHGQTTLDRYLMNWGKWLSRSGDAPVWFHDRSAIGHGGEWVNVYIGNLPDAVPGGVALHVEWTDCPTCGGRGFVKAGPMLRGGPICQTCQTPFVPPSGDPIVEVTT